MKQLLDACSSCYRVSPGVDKQDKSFSQISLNSGELSIAEMLVSANCASMRRGAKSLTKASSLPSKDAKSFAPPIRSWEKKIQKHEREGQYYVFWTLKKIKNTDEK